ncbi:hypothetical protein DL89DRAFT_267641 [Linderina pennispora]|uniref:Uncharacterized protein n=1 Tax=Linderina pennispora TaxID=61395 RepID=A0A1Y1W7U9_9FUNG|nr:uncharacterized protein DL89DRAFT_267641 [Linderina pennispora]ORX69408.1 hypothetical protein DL89DRAFT_267641 [Linderina pennispora]
MTQGFWFIGSVWIPEQPPAMGDGSSKTVHVFETWAAVVCALLCAVTLVSSYKTIRRFRVYFEDDAPANSSPSLFLLPWLSCSDIVATVANMMLLGFDHVGSASSIRLRMARRVLLTTQLSYMFTYVLLSIHVLSRVGAVNPRFERKYYEYYGPAAGLLAFFVTHEIIATLPGFYTFYRWLMPLATMACICTAAVVARSPKPVVPAEAPPADTRRLDESDVDELALGDCADYADYAKYAAALFAAFHAPWMLVSGGSCLVYVPCMILCARGLLPLGLITKCPVIINEHSQEQEHEHQE